MALIFLPKTTTKYRKMQKEREDSLWKIKIKIRFG